MARKPCLFRAVGGCTEVPSLGSMCASKEKRGVAAMVGKHTMYTPSPCILSFTQSPCEAPLVKNLVTFCSLPLVPRVGAEALIRLVGT